MRVTGIAALLLVAAGPVFAAKPHYLITGRVVAIADGDTLTVLDRSNTQHRVRLAGIDAPEKGQPFGTTARENLATKVFGKVVRVEVVDIDQYHRAAGRIYLGKRFINEEMVRDGTAWRYVQYDRHGEFTAAENDARAQGRGLWGTKEPPVPPWEWRRAKREASKSRQIEGSSTVR
jgi:endonuclease YncB( thermonuclease family)